MRENKNSRVIPPPALPPLLTYEELQKFKDKLQFKIWLIGTIIITLFVIYLHIPNFVIVCIVSLISHMLAWMIRDLIIMSIIHNKIRKWQDKVLEVIYSGKTRIDEKTIEIYLREMKRLIHVL